MMTGSLLPADNLKLLLLLLSMFPGLWAIYSFKFNKFRFNILPDIPENHELITTGIYRSIRHPMYTSVIFITLIWVWNEYSMLRLFIWIVLLTDLILKLRYEEKLLRKKYPEYSSYKKRTKMLIPFVF